MNRKLRVVLPHIVWISTIFILFVICYSDVLRWMYGRYMSPDSYYSHGFIIPFVSGYLIWRKREELREGKAEVSQWGLFIVVASALLHVAGTLIYVFSVSGFSIFLLLLGTSFLLLGTRITRSILFPLIFLLFMLPAPIAFISALSLPLKILVAKLGASIVSSLGLPVFGEGFNISIPEGNLVIGNPCSGLRSIITFLAIGALYVYLSKLTMIKRWILFSSTLPIALLSNLTRVVILILISYFFGLSAARPSSFWHDTLGILVFIEGLFLLFLGARILERKV